MGGSTRLKFPLPHRRSKKQPSQEILNISAPMTNKAQKLLGSAEISIDNASPTSPVANPKVWETRSAISGVSGISITISETTTPASVPGTAESTVTPGTTGRSKTAWDQESDIIPRGLGLSTTSSAARSQNLDVTTDASSLRRRRSSSTIVSYYDKSKLPLSISQQTSNSAMAKGFPGKAAEVLDGKGSEVLDMTCPRPAPKPPTMHKKKPSRLDLSHLIPASAASRLSRFSQKGKDNVNLVLGSDLFTRSPSIMSTPPAMSPPNFQPKPEKGKLRRKLTKESLRSLPATRWNSISSDTNSATTSLRKRATDTGNLNHLYEHYEKTSIRDTIDHDEPDAIPTRQPSDAGSHADSVAASRQTSRQSAPGSASPSTSKSRHHGSPSFSSVSWRPFPAYSPDEGCGTIAENPRVSATSSNLTSPAGDHSAASVSSRHTRTSRASKTTESFADFDPNATSVLSLSSDSEDDDLDPPRTTASVPSVGSRDSIVSSIDHRRRPSNTSSISVDPARAQTKTRYRSSLGTQAPFLAIPEDDAAAASPFKVNPRSSSLSSAITSNSPRPSVSTIASSVRSQSRLSQASMSTADSGPTHFSRPRPSAKASSPEQAPEVCHVAMLQSRTATPTPRQQDVVSGKRQGTPSDRSSFSPKRSQPMPPTSPPDPDLFRSGQCNSLNEQGGPILTLSGADAASEERFISVTRQEEMLLAAMRAKRALMRENLAAGNMERKGSNAASNKESLSHSKTIKATTAGQQQDARSCHVRKSSKKLANALHLPEPPSKPDLAVAARQSEEIPEEQEDILMCMDRTVSTMEPYDVAEPSPDLSDFIIDFDAEQFPVPPKASHSRSSSTASAAGRLTHPKPAQHHRQSSFGRPRPDSEFLPRFQPASPEEPLPLPFRSGVDLDAVASKTENAAGNSRVPIFATVLQEEEMPQPPSRKKAVRISAVGLQLPEVGQWGDDG